MILKVHVMLLLAAQMANLTAMVTDQNVFLEATFVMALLKMAMLDGDLTVQMALMKY